MKKKWIVTILFIGLVLISFNSFSQKEELKIGCIAFYNLENLFDTIIDPDTTKILQDDFTPFSAKRWDSEKYNKKLLNMSDVISQIGTEFVPTGPAVLGVSEIENRKVLEDLINTPKLKPLNYKIVHFDSPDRRGIDVGLIYQPKYFTVTNSKAIYVDVSETGGYTRDILLVSGVFDGEVMHFMVNHWSSRRGGEERSAPRRIKAATTARHHIDSILKEDPNAKIILMGDLNDNPTDESVRKHLGTAGKLKKVKNGKMFNPMEAYYKKGIGTGAYRDTWHLFDQLILTENLLGDDYSSYKLHKALIYNKPFMINNSGRFEGYPFRGFVGDTFQGGYSDHLPVYLFLVKNK